MQFTKNVEMKNLILNLKNIIIFLSLIRIIVSNGPEETEITERDINEVYDVNMNESYKAIHDSSKVYLAKRKTDGKEVIIKKPNQQEDLEFHVKHEYDVVKSLDHECIVKIIDKIYKNPSLENPLLFNYFLVFEKVEGQTFFDYINENMGRNFSSKSNDIIKYFRNKLITLEYIHKNNVIHCDLKDSDIIVNNGDIKILDFGQAGNSFIKRRFRKFSAKQRSKSMHYAPEIQEGKRYGTKADIYSLGWAFGRIYGFFISLLTENYELIEDLIEKCIKTPATERISATEALRHPLFTPFLPKACGFSQFKKFKLVKGDITLEKCKSIILISKDEVKIKIEEINPPKTPTLGLQRKKLDEFKFHINDEELNIHSVLNKHIDLIKIAFNEIGELSFRKGCLRESMNDQESTN